MAAGERSVRGGQSDSREDGQSEREGNAQIRPDRDQRQRAERKTFTTVHKSHDAHPNLDYLLQLASYSHLTLTKYSAV